MNQEMTLTKQEGRDEVHTPMNHNAECLAREIGWFARVTNARLREYFPAEKFTEPVESHKNGLDKLWSRSFAKKAKGSSDAPELISEAENEPDLQEDLSVYAEFVRYYKLNREERLLLILSIIPHVQPHLLDVFYSVNKSIGRGYTEFGGVKGNRHNGFIPTLETALFILAGNDMAHRFRLYRLFEPDHVLIAHNIIALDQGNTNEPFYSSSILISDEYLDFFTTGRIRKPQFSLEFPAKRLTTRMEWSDLVVDDFTAQQLEELRTWLKHGKTLYEDWSMAKKIKPGYKALFHGPPGTGKTLTAALLGKLFNLDVYRVDLSMVISKYIGETEKNLEKVFRKAENKNWILFFDEADALFGKRTAISDSHDKYANQEVAYLLQRLEDYAGLVILASNMKSNVDEAFSRRLQAVIHFQKPQQRERMKLWMSSFSPACRPPAREDLERISSQYELSGGSIINVVHFASLQALNRNDNIIAVEDLLTGIRKELKKEGRTL